MILPLRVLGRPGTNWTASGAAKAPICARTCPLSSALRDARHCCRCRTCSCCRARLAGGGGGAVWACQARADVPAGRHETPSLRGARRRGRGGAYVLGMSEAAAPPPRRKRVGGGRAAPAGADLRPRDWVGRGGGASRVGSRCFRFEGARKLRPV